MNKVRERKIHCLGQWKTLRNIKKGLTSAQSKKWARVANGRLRVCLAEGGSQDECEVSAIRIANSVCVKGGRRKQ